MTGLLIRQVSERPSANGLSQCHTLFEPFLAGFMQCNLAHVELHCLLKALCPAAYLAYRLKQFGNMITHSSSIFLCFFTVTRKEQQKTTINKYLNCQI